MGVRQVFSLLLAGIIALSSVVTWQVLQDTQQAQVAEIAEAESYAARSQLVRNVDTMLRALHDIKEYWLRYGHLPRDQWESDAGIELAHFQGIELILWSDRGRGQRYARTGEHPVFDYRPTDEEWETLEGLDDRAAQATEETMAGPFVDDSGKVTYEIYMPASDPRSQAHLAAVVDPVASFGHWLLDESPGYSISIYWRDVLLYERGEAAAGLPANWSREGMIRTTLGTLWQVVHRPTQELASMHTTPAVTGVLIAGLAVAALVGLLVLENGRAQSRASAAETAERELAKLNRDLERQISERVQELAERSADLETITDSVAHDLRNPLNAISVNTQLLQQQFHRVIGDEGRNALQRMTSSVRHMTEILDRLLGLSVVSQSIFNRQEIDMVGIAQEVFEELHATEQPPEIQFRVDDLPPAHADPVLVRTLVINLLSNAIKYTRDKPERRVEVCFETHERSAGAYCIRDNGIGFDPEAAERMFRAFERLDGNGDADGIGLGLNIAARVVRRHGGQIWAEGAVDEGASIYFTLAPEA